MTVRELCDRVRAIPGAASDEENMIMWLNDCEGVIFHELLRPREGCPISEFAGYGDEDGEAVLLVPDPYSILYVHYVAAQIYLSYADMARYNNYIALYQDAYEEFAGFWARGHRQAGNVRILL